MISAATAAATRRISTGGLGGNARENAHGFQKYVAIAHHVEQGQAALTKSPAASLTSTKATLPSACDSVGLGQTGVMCQMRSTWIRWAVCLGMAVMVLAALPHEAVADKPIVAVFDIQTSANVRLSKQARSNLSDYLASRLTSSGAFQLVLKDKLKEALRQKKSQSYKRCYAQKCQIAIGQELSAACALCQTR